MVGPPVSFYEVHSVSCPSCYLGMNFLVSQQAGGQLISSAAFMICPECAQVLEYDAETGLRHCERTEVTRNPWVVAVRAEILGTKMTHDAAKLN